MSIGESLLPEFEFECAITRRVIERVPVEKWNWQPHEMSHTMGWNSNHLAQIVGWAWETLEADEWDIHPPGGEPEQSPKLESPPEVLALFDENLEKAKQALSTATDEQMTAMWSLLKGGETIMQMPRVAVMRTWVVNHMIHHRAVLTVYLRLNDIPVPAIYGPSGDEAAPA